MDNDLRKFKDNFDAWVKELRSEISGLKDFPAVVNENTGNIQHNYEIMQGLNEEVSRLKEEVKILKLMHLAVLKTNLKN